MVTDKFSVIKTDREHKVQSCRHAHVQGKLRHLGHEGMHEYTYSFLSLQLFRSQLEGCAHLP